jgi:hypothetical protein
VSISGSTAQQAIYLRDIKKIDVKLPSIEEQTQIVQEIESRLLVADKLVETIQTNVQKAEALRQSILKKAFEGRLLSEAEVEACRKEADWEPAERLFERIKSEKKKINTMPIPQNIQREHVFQAMLKIQWEGIPPRRGLREYAVNYENQLFPVKLIISWANIFANGEELDSDASNFNSLRAKKYLEDLGFNVVDL